MLMIFYIYRSLSRVKMMVEKQEYSLENVIYLSLSDIEVVNAVDWLMAN